VNSNWCIWSIPFLMAFCRRPENLRCNLSVFYFCFPLFKCLSPSHSSNGFSDPVNCCSSCWIPGFMPQFSQICFCISSYSKLGTLLFRSKRMSMLVDNLYAEVTEAALSISSPESVWILGEVNSEARLWNCSKYVKNDWQVIYVHCCFIIRQ